MNIHQTSYIITEYVSVYTYFNNFIQMEHVDILLHIITHMGVKFYWSLTTCPLFLHLRLYCSLNHSEIFVPLSINCVPYYFYSMVTSLSLILKKYVSFVTETINLFV